VCMCLCLELVLCSPVVLLIWYISRQLCVNAWCVPICLMLPSLTSVCCLLFNNSVLLVKL
jgi:hypothetical protein